MKGLENSIYLKQKNNRKRKHIVIISAVIFCLLFIAVILYALLFNGGSDNNVSDASLSAVDESSLSVSNEVSDDSDVSDESVAEPDELPEPEEWYLLLVNRDNPVPEGYTVELEEIENGHKVDSRIADALRTMFADAKSEGILPRVTSAYRPAEQQIAELQEYIDRYITQGMTQEEAETEAQKWVAAPGYSEHETGLAVDISTADWSLQNADVVWNWLANNSWKYGFILRYTQRCNEITGASVEPWHFRYVGKDAAKEIYESGVCLEEYLQ